MLKMLVSWVLLSFLVLSPAAQAKEVPANPTNPAISAAPNEADLKEHGHYINANGNEVHSPAHSKSGAIPNGASAQCRDGSYSFSQNHRGTCSHHGGVGVWLR